MRVIVLHRLYGCDTGCCGHVIVVDNKDVGDFNFDHPYNEDPRAFAEDLVREALGEDHVSDLDWNSCVVVDD